MDPVQTAIREALEREAARLDEQAEIFTRMGYAPDELMILVDRREGRNDTNVVPKSISSS